MKRTLPRLALPLALLLLAGCGDETADTPASDGDDVTAVEFAPAPATDIAEPGTAAAPVLTAAAIDPLVLGIGRENAMLASVAERMPAAADDAARLALMTEVQPATLEAEGAVAAGMEAQVYRQLKDQLFTVVGEAEMHILLSKQFADVDTTGLDADAAALARSNAEEMKSQLGDPYAGVDPGAAESIRARLQELTELRATHIGLLFKAAGG